MNKIQKIRLIASFVGVLGCGVASPLPNYSEGYVDLSGKEKRKALILRVDPSADPRGEFKDFDNEINRVTDAGYEVTIKTIFEPSNFDGDLYSAFIKAGGPFDYFLGGAHGGPRGIKLRQKNLGDRIFRDRSSGILRVRDIKGKDYSYLFNEGARGVLVSSSVADTSCAYPFAQGLADAFGISLEGYINSPRAGGLDSELHLAELDSTMVKKRGFSKNVCPYVDEEGYGKYIGHYMDKEGNERLVFLKDGGQIEDYDQEKQAFANVPSDFKEDIYCYEFEKLKTTRTVYPR